MVRPHPIVSPAPPRCRVSWRSRLPQHPSSRLQPSGNRLRLADRVDLAACFPDLAAVAAAPSCGRSLFSCCPQPRVSAAAVAPTRPRFQSFAHTRPRFPSFAPTRYCCASFGPHRPCFPSTLGIKGRWCTRTISSPLKWGKPTSLAKPVSCPVGRSLLAAARTKQTAKVGDPFCRLHLSGGRSQSEPRTTYLFALLPRYSSTRFFCGGLVAVQHPAGLLSDTQAPSKTCCASCSYIARIPKCLFYGRCPPKLCQLRSPAEAAEIQA